MDLGQRETGHFSFEARHWKYINMKTSSRRCCWGKKKYVNAAGGYNEFLC